MSVQSPIGAFRDSDNDVSMGRIIAFIACCLGVFVVLNGLAAMWVELLAPIRAGARLTEPLEVMGLGVTLVGGSVGMKGWQTTLENKQTGAPAAAPSAPQ